MRRQRYRLFSNGGESFYWTGPNGFSTSEQNPVIENASVFNSGTYTFFAEAETETECVAKDSLVLVVLSGLNTDAVDDFSVCKGDDIQLGVTAEGATSFFWRGPNNYISTEQNPLIGQVDESTEGLYLVAVMTDNCTEMDSVFVTVNDLPTANFTTTPANCETLGSVSLEVQGGATGFTFDWSDLAGTLNIGDRPEIEAGTL